MNVDQLMDPSIPILSTEDTGDTALAMMEDNNHTQLPLVADEHYIGIVQENDLLGWPDTSVHFSENAQLLKPAIIASAHPFEAIRIMHQMSVSVLPVIDSDHRYLGAVTKDTLLKFVAETSGVDNPGGIIVLEIAPRNYSLYEIARICENEDVMIINLQVHTNEAGKLEVTMKLNRSALDAVVSSFERHDYHVKEVFGQEVNTEDIEGKYNLLMNYINM
jgi:predicted transcriptional regulator